MKFTSLLRPCAAPSLRALFLTLTALSLGSGVSPAADGTWTGTAGTGEWSNAGNWNPGIPGATTGIANTETAIFNTTGALPITIDAGRNVRNLTFAAGAGAFTLGSLGANGGEALHLSSGGTLSLAAGATGTVTVNAPLILEPVNATTSGTYTFSNTVSSASTTGTTPKINVAGNISGGATTTASARVTLVLAGSVGTRNANSQATALAQANTISGIISDGDAAGGLAITVNGTNAAADAINAWYLTGLNTYSGNTTITLGTLYFNSIGNIGEASSLGTTGNIAVNSNLIYVGGAATSDRFFSSNAGTLYNNGTGILTLNGDISIDPSRSFTVRGTTGTTINGLISGAGASLNRTNNGSTLTLTNASNSFTGGLVISAGTISANSIANGGQLSAIGAGSTISFGQNQTSDNIGTFQFTGANGGSSDRAIIFNAGTTNTSGAPATAVIENMVAGQTLTLSGAVRTSGSVATHFTALVLGGAGNGVMSGELGGATSATTTASNMTLTKNGTGTWSLTNANIFNGVTTVNAGVLNIRNNTALGTTAGGTVVASGGTLQLQGGIAVGAETLSLAGAGATGQTGALVNVSGNNTYAGALTLAATTTISSDSGRLDLTSTTAVVGSATSRVLTLAGAGDGSLAGALTTTSISGLTKTGTGTWTLSGANTYTVATTINGGTLNVTGTLGNTAVTVNSGGTFAYAGALGSTLTVANGGGLTIGNSTMTGTTGTLTTNVALVLNNFSFLNFDLGATSDLIQANGALTLDGIVRVTPGAGFTSRTYKLIDYAGALTNNGLVAQVLAGYDLAISVDTPNQDVNLTATAISAQYWDGTDTVADSIVDGGNGVWTNAGMNWTSADGTTNTSWTASTEKIAVFGGVAAGGTVQVQDAVAVNGLQFANSYTLASGGGQLQISNAATEVRVNPNATATVAAPITGAGGINKTGDGVLVFTQVAGANTYTGTTLVTSGTLKIATNNALPTGGNVAVGSGTFVGTLDLSTASQQISSLQVTSNNSGSDNVINIGAGQTLSVTGTNSVRIGVANVNRTQTRAVFTGGGSLVVNNANGNFDAGIQVAGMLLPESIGVGFDDPLNANNTIADMSGLGSFSATVADFRVGFGLLANTTLTLSNTSNVISARNLQLANSNGANSGTVFMVLGSGTNIIQANTINIGVSKGVATLRFASQVAGSAGTVVIGGRDQATTNIVVGSSLDTNTGAQPTGTLDLTGHVATVTANSLIIGKRSSPGNGGVMGTVSFNAGTFTANTVEIGTMSGNPGSSTVSPAATGTLNIGGGTFTVNAGGSFTLGTYSNTNTYGTATATLNLTGGTLITNVDILEGGGATSTTANTISTINLNGGTLDMTGHNIGSAAFTINVLTFAAGTLKDVGEINGGAAFNKTTTGTLILQGDNRYTGATTVSAGTLLMNNTPSGTASATGTNTVTVNSGATLGGQGLITSSVTLSTGATLAPGGNATSIAANAIGVNTDTGTMAIGGDLNVGSGATVALQLKTQGTHGLTPVFDTNNRLSGVTGTTLDGGNDRLTIGGTLTLDTASNLVVTFGTGYTPNYRDTFDLIDWVGTIPLAYYDDGDGRRNGGTADNNNFALDLPDLTAFNTGWFWDVSQFGTTGVIAIVPEPSRALLVLGGLLTLGMRRRRKQTL